MFAIGDKVVYPMHGAGVIESIEEKEVLGEKRAYYILQIPYGRIQVMVPVDGCEKAGLRGIMRSEQIDAVLKVLGAEATAMDDNWNRRLRDNTEKLKTGDPAQVAEVIRNLVRNERVKKLSAGEKKLLNNAKQILSSEIVLVRGMSEEAALALIEQSV